MSRQHVALLLTLLLGVFMSALDIFIVSPALVPIEQGLHISASTVTWSFTAYTLVLVVSQPLVGKLSDLLGRRGIYIACVVLFGLGSILCSAATGFGPFILGRCIQAVGAGGVLPLASAVIADTFPVAKRGTALGIVGSVFGLAFIIGPLLGGVLTGGIHIGALVTDWRAIFLVNVPLALLIIVLAARTVPVRPAHPADHLIFDGNGAALLALALFCLVLGLTQLNFSNLAANFTNEAAIPFILLGIALLIPFWLNELRAADPIVTPRVFSRRQIIIALALGIGGSIVTGSVVYIPQLVEATLRLNHPGAGGFYLFWVAIALTLGTGATGRMIDRVGSRAVMLFGCTTTALALVLLLVIGSGPVGLVISLILIGLGLSTFVGTPLRYIIVNEAPPDRRASSLSMLTICNSLGQTIILPLGGALLASVPKASSNPASTVQAIHIFYTLVLVIVVVAIMLTLGLKRRAQEHPPQQPRPQRAPATQAVARAADEAAMPSLAHH